MASVHERHGRLGAAIRWGRPEAADLARQVAIANAVTALIELKKHRPDARTVRRLAFLMNGELPPWVTDDPVTWVLE